MDVFDRNKKGNRRSGRGRFEAFGDRERTGEEGVGGLFSDAFEGEQLFFGEVIDVGDGVDEGFPGGGFGDGFFVDLFLFRRNRSSAFGEG